MQNLIFGEVSFNTGWKTTTDITLFNKSYRVTVKAKAYFENEAITPEQEEAYKNFKIHKNETSKVVENLLKHFDDTYFSQRFIPQVLLFQRNGDVALLLDDNDDKDNGIVVCLVPKTEILLQDEYL